MQIEDLVDTAPNWVEVTLAPTLAVIAGDLTTPLEQRVEDLGRNSNQVDTLAAAETNSVTFLEHGKSYGFTHSRESTVQPQSQDVRALLQDFRGESIFPGIFVVPYNAINRCLHATAGFHMHFIVPHTP